MWQTRQRFPYAVLDEERQTSKSVTIVIALCGSFRPILLLPLLRSGWLAAGGFCGNDERTLNGSFAIYYALSMEEGEKCWIVVRAFVDADRQEFPSVTIVCPPPCGASAKSETCTGLPPVGLLDMRRLVLPDDWPDNLQPLRKRTAWTTASALRPPRTRKPTITE